MAGVIGRRQFTYDLWGDTVNIASRMYSHASPNVVQVTKEFKAAVMDNFTLEPHPEGEIVVKGKGLMEVWHLKGPRDDDYDDIGDSSDVRALPDADVESLKFEKDRRISSVERVDLKTAAATPRARALDRPSLFQWDDGEVPSERVDHDTFCNPVKSVVLYATSHFRSKKEQQSPMRKLEAGKS